MVTLQLRLTADRADKIADAISVARGTLRPEPDDQALAEEEARLRHAAARARRREIARRAEIARRIT